MFLGNAKAGTKGTVTALYDYNSGIADDLTFFAGDEILVKEKVNDDWIRGQINGRTGLVPLTFVTRPGNI